MDEMISLITDRTQSDVDMKTSKGFYMASDVNRVNTAIYYIVEKLKSIGYRVDNIDLNIWGDIGTVQLSPVGNDSLLTANGDRFCVATPFSVANRDNIPTESTTARYLSNIDNLRSVISVFESTPETPESMKNFTFESANDIEKILTDVNTLVDNISKNLNLGWALGIADIGIYTGV